jgi:hypothetical protein
MGIQDDTQILIPEKYNRQSWTLANFRKLKQLLRRALTLKKFRLKDFLFKYSENVLNAIGFNSIFDAKGMKVILQRVWAAISRSSVIAFPINAHFANQIEM